MIKQIGNLLLKTYRKDFIFKTDKKNFLSGGKSLNNLLLHAYHNATYYRKIFKEIGLIKN